MFEGMEDAASQKWSSKSYELKEFLKVFQLPQTVRIVEGNYNEENKQDIFRINDIIILQNHEKICQIFVTDSREESEEPSCNFPWGCETKVIRVAAEFAHSRLTARDILKHLSKVLFVRIPVSDVENGLERKEKFRIIYESVQNHGESFSFVLESATDTTKRVKITQDTKALFQPILEPNEYSISEIAKTFALPQYVISVDDLSLKESLTYANGEENDRVLKLETTSTNSVITFSNLLDTETLFCLQINQELVICPTLDPEFRETSLKTSGEMISEDYNEDRQSENSNEARSAIYEDMTSYAIKSFLETPCQGNRRSKGDNPYTTAPSSMKTFAAKLNSTLQHPRKVVYQSERKIIEVETLKNDALSSESWYDVPTVLPGKLQTEVDNTDDEPIYQEINFRKPLEERKTKETVSLEDEFNDISEAVNIRTSHHADGSSQVFCDKSTGHNCQANADEGFKITTKINDTFQKEIQGDSHSKHPLAYKRAFSTSLSSQKISAMSKHQHKQGPTSQRSHSVGSLEGAGFLSSSITESIAKSKLFTLQSEKIGKIGVAPPTPPPRTSSISSGESSLSSDPSIKGKQTGSGNSCLSNEKTSRPTSKNDIANGKQPFPVVPFSRTRSVSVPQINDSKSFQTKEFDLESTSNKAETEENPMHEKQQPLRHKLLSRSRTEASIKTTNKSLKALKPNVKSKPKVSCPQKHVTTTHKEPKLEKSQEPYNTLSRYQPTKTVTEDSFDIPDSLRGLSVSEVCACLEKLNLDSLVELFKRNLIDGEIFVELDEATMVDMKIEKLQRLKISKFIEGWRPRL